MILHPSSATALSINSLIIFIILSFITRTLANDKFENTIPVTLQTDDDNDHDGKSLELDHDFSYGTSPGNMGTKLPENGNEDDLDGKAMPPDAFRSIFYTEFCSKHVMTIAEKYLCCRYFSKDPESQCDVQIVDALDILYLAETLAYQLPNQDVTFQCLAKETGLSFPLPPKGSQYEFKFLASLQMIPIRFFEDALRCFQTELV